MSQPDPSPRGEPGDPTLRFRAVLVGSVMLSVFSLLSWRLIHLQVDRHAYYRAEMETGHRRTDTLEAHRGSILDQRGRILACDEPVKQIVFELNFLSPAAKLSEALAASEGVRARDLTNNWSLTELQDRYLSRVCRVLGPAAGMTPEEAEAKIRQRYEGRDGPPRGEVLFQKAMALKEASLLRTGLEALQLGNWSESRSSLGGVIFRDAWVRSNPSSVSMPHIVGVFAEPERKDKNDPPIPPRGVAGIERTFEDDLRGTPGSRTFEVDGWNNEIPAYRGTVIPPRHGRNLRLLTDAGLQEILEAELDAAPSGPKDIGVAELDADRVIVVLFDPRTMGLTAVASRDRRGAPPAQVLSNPAVEYTYEPGSTLKIVTLAAALSSGRVNPDTHISIPSGDYDDGDVIPIGDDHTWTRGWMTVEEILVHSSNIGSYKLARMVGTGNFERYLTSFGFGQKTGLGLSGESRGIFPNNMNLQTLSRVAFGHAISVTPAQICGALGGVINDGNFRPLRLTDAWVDDSGAVIEQIDGEEPRSLMKAGDAAAIRRAMLQVVEAGTAKDARSDYYTIAGKTGTAELPKKEGGYGKDVTASFLGFIPADKPRLGGIVIVQRPRSEKHNHYGGAIAGPIFRRIAEKAMAYYEVPPQFNPGDAARAAAANSDTRHPLQPVVR